MHGSRSAEEPRRCDINIGDREADGIHHSSVANVVRGISEAWDRGDYWMPRVRGHDGEEMA
jgi:hypothetical protein